MSSSSGDVAEKAVKMVVENHRMALTLVGLFIAGLFAYAAKGANTLDWRYYWALLCFVLAGVGIIIPVSVAISQAANNSYNPADRWMTIPYVIALGCIVIGLAFAAWFLVRPQSAVSSTTAASGIQIDASGTRVTIGSDMKVKTIVHWDPSGEKVQSVEVNP